MTDALNSNSSPITSRNPYAVLLLIPNIIGYIRLALLAVVVLTALHHPLIAFVAYFISGNLDAVDGYCARKFNQESRIGTILDYAIDRTSDTLLFLILVIIYPQIWGLFCILLMLDIFSHICQVYSTVFSALKNHKLVGREQGPILRLYYTNRIILYIACASYGMWMACFYLYHFFPEHWILVISFIFLPGFIFKVIIHFLQIIAVFRRVAATDSVNNSR